MRGRRSLLLVVIAALFGSACSSGTSGRSGDGGSGASSCRRRAGENTAKAVLRCTEKSVAFVETETGSGTGVVITVASKPYLVTNLHVVDPFDGADVTLGGRTLDDVAVVGVDVEADIALLGPLPGKNLPASLPIADGTDLERGDEVFLVNFLGGSDADDLEATIPDDKEATIASVIVSRLRSAKEFDQSYIQTVTSGRGRTGGPLFDGAARLVGISGLSFAEDERALAGRHVRDAVGPLAAGKGDRYLGLPVHTTTLGSKGAGAGTLRVADATDEQVLYLPAAGEERTWRLNVDMEARPVVSVVTTGPGKQLALSANAVDLQRQPDDGPDLPGPEVAARETSPGVFEIPVKADESALVVAVLPLTDSPVKVAWRSDLPLVLASGQVGEESLEVGATIEHLLGSFDTGVDVLVDLAEGQRVRLYARTAQGDVGFRVFKPGQSLDHVTVNDDDTTESFRDDTEDGLFGLVNTTFEAQAAGRHRIRLYAYGSTINVRFSVTDCAGKSCEEPKKAAPF